MGWKLVWSGGPRPERGWKIGCKIAVQISLRVADRRGGGHYMEGEGVRSIKKVERWDGVLR